MGQSEPWVYHGTDHFRAQKARGVLASVDKPEVVRLHLGAGRKYFRDYINIDLKGPKLDLVQDIRTLPYGDETVDEILMIHVIEHIWATKVELYLKEYYRVLKKGGKLIMEAPDLRKVLEFFKQDDPPAGLTYGALYGEGALKEGEREIEDMHKWCWTYSTLRQVAEKVGFKTSEEVAQFHVPQRDFRIVCVKE